jgi:hypothetical protein
MKRLIVVLIALLVLTSITLAAKGGNKPPDVDVEALIAEEAAAREAADIALQNNITAEETARQGGDAALLSQIDNIPLGAVQVYDNAGQYLGFLTDVSRIYVPSLEKFIIIDLYEGNIVWDKSCYYSGKPFFKTSDCTGQAYFWLSSPSSGHGTFEYHIIVDTSRPEPHFYSITGPITEHYTLTYLEGGVCTPADAWRPVAPGYEVTLPFTTPVALPLSFE